MPKKTENNARELDAYIEKLVNRGAKAGSVTEDEIQIVLKDVEVSDSQLGSIYQALRDQGVEVISQSEDGDAGDIVVDDDLSDDLDDESSEDHDIKIAKNADAENALASVSNKNCAYYNNAAGVVALRKGDLNAAAAAFSKSNIKEASYNLAVIDILNGSYADAAAKLDGAGTFNEALAYILTNDLNAASEVLGDAQCPCKNYLKAIIAARQGNVEAANAALETASQDEALAERAENDIEFAKIR